MLFENTYMCTCFACSSELGMLWCRSPLRRNETSRAAPLSTTVWRKHCLVPTYWIYWYSTGRQQPTVSSRPSAGRHVTRHGLAGPSDDLAVGTAVGEPLPRLSNTVIQRYVKNSCSWKIAVVSYRAIFNSFFIFIFYYWKFNCVNKKSHKGIDFALVLL